MQQLNHSKLLQVLVGAAGDYFIGTSSITTKKFARIKITAEAVLTTLKIRGVDVVTDRAYGTLPVGHELVAGGDDYFDNVKLASGSAIGFLLCEDTQISGLAVAVIDGVKEAAMAPEITFNNTGGNGSEEIYYRVKNKTHVIVQEGSQVLYFLKGTGVKVSLQGLLYFNVPDTGYRIEITFDKNSAWTTSSAFEITAT